MGIDLYGALMGAIRYPGSQRRADLSQRNTAAASSSFGEQAVAASSGRKVATYTPDYIAPMPKLGPNALYAGSHCSGQSLGIEYTEDSTEEDPIVRICGISWSGEYDYTMHINDIDARNATYPELCALVQHQAKIGQYQSGQKYNRALPSEMDRGDYSKRQDFTQSLRGCISKNQRYNPDVAQDARNLLSFYENFAAEHADKANTYTENQLDALLDTVGRARIENNQNVGSAEARSAAEHRALIAAAANAAFENTPLTESEEILDRLSDSAKATLEDIKADKEVSQEEWLGLLGELRDMGAISDTELGYTRGDLRVVPLGYRDGNGGLVRYGNAGRFAEARLLQLAGLETSEDAVVDWNWNNDPLAFLDDWIAELTEWRDDLSRERSASGAPKYDDFSPIDDQVAACTKVRELIEGLAAQTE